MSDVLAYCDGYETMALCAGPSLGVGHRQEALVLPDPELLVPRQRQRRRVRQPEGSGALRERREGLCGAGRR